MQQDMIGDILSLLAFNEVQFLKYHYLLQMFKIHGVMEF